MSHWLSEIPTLKSDEFIYLTVLLHILDPNYYLGVSFLLLDVRKSTKASLKQRMKWQKRDVEALKE